MNQLAIFAKHPMPGAVKSRLAAETTTEWAAQVADAFIRDLADKLAHFGDERLFAYTPASTESQHYFANIAGDRYSLIAQVEGDLGTRLRRFIEQQFTAGPRRLVIIGSDSPTIPVEFITQAFDALASHDLVLGPATDGGYYLIGCRQMPPIFTGISWGGPQVLAQTVAAFDGSLTLLPPWYDVDTLADWWTLTGHVAGLRRMGVDPAIPRTEALLQERAAGLVPAG